jgi:hypothetical protein
MEKIEYLSFDDYKKSANDFIKSVGMSNSKNLPLDIEMMIEKNGHNIVSFQDLQKDFKIKGMVIKTTIGFDIGVDSYHYMNEKEEFYYKFTLAEEMAHILIHLAFFDEADSKENAIKIHNNLGENEYKIMENQAKNVANCLLLPDWLFDDYVMDYVEQNIDKLKEMYYTAKEQTQPFIDDGSFEPNIVEKRISEYISRKLSTKLKLSEWVIHYTIFKRYPLLINKILLRFEK